MQLRQSLNLHNRPMGFKVWIYDGNCANAMLRAHSHPDVEFNFVLRGRMRYTFGGRTIDVLPGRLTVFWGSIPHQSIEPDSETLGIWGMLPLPLVLGWKLPKKFDERLLRGEFIQTRNANQYDQRDRLLLAQWTEDYLRKDADSHRTLELEIEARLRRLAQESTVDAAFPRVDPEPGIQSALAYIHAHYHEALRTQDIAVAAGWNESYLLRKFRITLSVSVGEYVNRMRMTHAQWLLAATEKKIIDIAFESGYQSVAPFYQAFKRSGLGSPLEYRKRAKEEVQQTTLA